MKNFKKISLVLLSIVFLAACKKDVADPNPTYYSESKPLTNGNVKSWIKFTGDVPTSIGITLSKGALEKLVHETPNAIVSLPLPTEAIGKTPFNHVFIGYLHTGHEPPGIYDVAHFDVHFVMQTIEERSAIPVYLPETAMKFDNLPSEGIIPKPYFRLPAGVPGMGVHWADPRSPELNGQKFVETLVYGSYDGKMTFLEPMISAEFLLSKPNLSKSVPTPSKFDKAGYFPMKYSIKQEGDEVVISLDDFMMMQ